MRPRFSRSIAVQTFCDSHDFDPPGTRRLRAKENPRPATENSAIVIQSIFRPITDEMMNGSKWLM